MIRFDNVWKRYPNGREALCDFTLGIERGAHDDVVGRAERQIDELDALGADRLDLVNAVERVARLYGEH